MGIINLVCCREADIEPVQLHQSSWKAHLGNGRATKGEVAEIIATLFDMEKLPVDDSVDAIAIGYAGFMRADQQHQLTLYRCRSTKRHRWNNPNKFNCSIFQSKAIARVANPRTQKMLRLLLEMDCSNELIAALLELSEFSIHHIRYLAGPISVHQCGWSESLPQWLPKAIYLDRFDAIVAENEKEIVGELATPSEVAACIYPATLIAPLERYWADVYLWAANESMTKHGKLPEGRTFWEVQGIQPVQMSGYIKTEDGRRKTECYDRIARDIRRLVVGGKQAKRLGQETKSGQV